MNTINLPLFAAILFSLSLRSDNTEIHLTWLSIW